MNTDLTVCEPGSFQVYICSEEVFLGLLLYCYSCILILWMCWVNILNMRVF